jgi:uncharacterized protein (TIGR02300 family)
MATATKAARGTKRTCQNSDCGSRFYDLGRSPVVCPICDSKYVLGVTEAAAAAVGAAAGADKTRKAQSKKPEFEMVDDETKAALAGDGDEALADIEGTDEPVAVEDDETFLEEEEEDGGNVSGIIGPGGEPEEEQ